MTDTWRITARGAVKQGPSPRDWHAGFDAALDLWRQGTPRAETSGSTGAPQPHDFTAQAVRASAESTAVHFGLKPQAGGAIHAWSALPPSGTGGRMMVWRALVLGWELTVSPPSASPTVPPADTADGRYHFAVATPMQAAHLLDSGQLPRFHTLLLGGAPVSASLEQRLIRAAGQAKMKLYHGFGMTETLTHIATRALGDPAYCTLPGIGIATNEAGALVVHAPERGVHHLVTRDAIELRPMTNGADAQAFTWLGRLDDVINSGGLNLHPSAIEAELGPRISALIQGRRWYVAGRTDSRLGHRVALVLEGAEDTALEEAVMNAVRDMGLSRPRSVEFMALFEETNTGKVRRK